MDNASYSWSLLDLPVADILVDHVAPYLTWKDLTKFRTCSRKCKELADQMFAGIRELVLDYGYKGPIPLILQTCRQLRIIFLGYVTLRNDQVHQLMSNNRLLDTVSIIDSCKRITSRGLVPLVSCNKIKHLALVSMDIHDEFLIEFANNNKKLKSVNFRRCYNFSVEALQHFFRNEPELEVINLSCSYFDISPILTTISQTCFNLQRVKVYGSIIRDRNVLKNFTKNRRRVEFYIKCYDSDSEMLEKERGISLSYARNLWEFNVQISSIRI
ncbi:F-box/LRR-repeat protein 15-like [Lutzomyia longipalpis]|uniref:F-box/LRR-repeat protein 15-like n=1 Tax=Lutzomyia longipalpis TaxID=7200 RepID=UPI002484175C|nr:F-box/LRR-repeat protein 15-like [Lutzomyia longipalpis]